MFTGTLRSSNNYARLNHMQNDDHSINQNYVRNNVIPISFYTTAVLHTIPLVFFANEFHKKQLLINYIDNKPWRMEHDTTFATPYKNIRSLKIITSKE